MINLCVPYSQHQRKDSEMVRKTKLKMVHALTAHVQETEPNIFEQVRFFLSHAYKISRRAQTVILAHDAWRDNSEELDGRGGSAILTELFLRVLGRKLSIKRELCKRVLIAAAWSLHMPVFITPSGAVSLRMSPSGNEPKIATALLKMVKALPFPDEVHDLIVAFAGDLWVGQQKTRQRNLFQFTASYALEAYDPKARKLIKAVVPFDNSTLYFCNSYPVKTEWDGPSKLLWLMCTSIWPFITLLRCYQRRKGAPSGSVTIRGFGVVLI